MGCIEIFILSLSISTAGEDSDGAFARRTYVFIITQGMGRKVKPLAIFFVSAVGLACFPHFTTHLHKPNA